MNIFKVTLYLRVSFLVFFKILTFTNNFKNNFEIYLKNIFKGLVLSKFINDFYKRVANFFNC